MIPHYVTPTISRSPQAANRSQQIGKGQLNLGTDQYFSVPPNNNQNNFQVANNQKQQQSQSIQSLQQIQAMHAMQAIQTMHQIQLPQPQISPNSRSGQIQPFTNYQFYSQQQGSPNNPKHAIIRGNPPKNETNTNFTINNFNSRNNNNNMNNNVNNNNLNNPNLMHSNLNLNNPPSSFNNAAFNKNGKNAHQFPGINNLIGKAGTPLNLTTSHNQQTISISGTNQIKPNVNLNINNTNFQNNKLNNNSLNTTMNLNINNLASNTSRKFPIPDVHIPKETETDIPSQNPSFFRDPETGEYGMHCVCGKVHVDGLLIQCEHCDLWLHGMCVNIPRLSPSDPYICPFCLGQRIKCSCGNTMAFNDPLIRCSKCNFYFHKECEGLFFGVVPKNFICSRCGGSKKYKFPMVKFDENYPNKTKILIDTNKVEIVESIPDGLFKEEIIEDLNCSELEFQATLEKYFQKFAALLFDGPHEFWRVFISTLCGLLNSEKNEILDAIDHLTYKFLYRENKDHLTNVEFSHSDSITEYLETSSLQRFERPPDSIELYLDDESRVRSPVSIDDGSYIADLPGFLMHTDEVDADNGIPNSCILVTNSDIIVDMNGTSFPLATKIRRSFHFNAIVKLIRVRGEARVALFATRMKGPLSEEKNRRGPAIPENGEIILPFDAGMPYDVQKVDWKEKKTRYMKEETSKNALSKNPNTNSNAHFNTHSNSHSNASHQQQQRLKKDKKREKEKRKKNNQKKVVCDFNLTLLSSFESDIVPPMPFILLPDQNAVDKYKMLQMVKSHSRHS
ncbi:hypothetical protein TRFO_09858 [Tritrichomonas foetus]|uniref:PHD-type domain-containing protein n=1 Tax=Tritrichomonas foetus TaxID=1144522 RepID=A0A1J4JGU8_9EUKA|nr:hypothetical protein TRFO_09858 [Tritrichomonas foetus]|eukprot:OHS96693.1 hypothetical protein TRFO_09858 [Tritrichomonas foetus]